MEIKFDPKKLKVVNIDEVRPNSYNPKDQDTKEFEKVKESIRFKGLRAPIVVRNNNGYEIVDGEQRWRASKSLEMDKVIIYDEGEMSDKDAKELTIWYQQQVPFNEIELAGLVTSMMQDYEGLELPFNSDELAEMEKLAEFDWDDFDERDKNKDEEEFKTLSIILTADQYDVVMEAFDKVKVQTGDDQSDSRAIELICADYLGGK